MPDANPAPPYYARAPIMPPWLTGTLIVGGGLAVGALVSRTALAATGPKPTPTPTPSTEPVRLGVGLTSDPQTGQITAGWTYNDPRVKPGGVPEHVMIRGPLPVRVLVSVPENMHAFGAEAGQGSRLLAGVPEQSKDFVFSLDEYGDPSQPLDQKRYSAVMTVQFTPQVTGMMVQVPLILWAVPG